MSQTHCSVTQPLQHGFGICVYGNWCGETCEGENNGGAQIDNLDTACFVHDHCLRKYKTEYNRDPTPCERCACDHALREEIMRVSTQERKKDGGRSKETGGVQTRRLTLPATVCEYSLSWALAPR